MDGGPWGRDHAADRQHDGMWNGAGSRQRAGNWNHAASGAYVGQQNGANYGQTTFHNYGDTYNVRQDDAPERKFQVALSHLAGGMPRLAEQILDDLVRSGFHSAEVAYYFAVASLADRSLNDIDREVRDRYINACLIAEQQPVDRWRTALDAVGQLMSTAWRAEPPAVDTLQEIIASFAELPSPRQSEIRRHLHLLIDGTVQDGLDDLDEQRIVHERMERDRVGRAWKFFHPDPAPPRRMPVDHAALDATGRAKLLAGLLGVVAGIVALIAGLGGAPATGAAVPLLMFGGALAARCEIARTRRRLRRARKDREHGIPYVPQPPVSPGHWVRTKFVQEVHQQVDAAFRAARPHIAGDWEAASRGLREHLKARLVWLYGNVRVQPAPAGLDWLIRWHAERIAATWRNGTLFDYQAEVGPRPGAITAGVRAGVGLVVVGLLVLAARGGFAAAILIGVGGYHAGRYGAVHLATRRDEADSHAENEQLFAEEQRAYWDWRQMLSDRPSDGEMATWLDLDKSYLKSCALKRARLSNRDIIAHVVMTEKAAGAMRARAVPGPPRYSDYVVLVFLLTHNGVREVEVDLNFLTGAVSDERRTSFRYDALASARVAETGVRTAGVRMTGVRISGDDPTAPAPADSAEIVAVRSLEFTLTLVNSESIKVTVENFSDPDQPEDQAQLMSNALQSSGVASALHVLEAVAAEGGDWIRREQERRRRASYEWYAIDDQDPLARA